MSQKMCNGKLSKIITGIELHCESKKTSKNSFTSKLNDKFVTK